jgi:hypothetical protein
VKVIFREAGKCRATYLHDHGFFVKGAYSSSLAIIDSCIATFPWVKPPEMSKLPKHQSTDPIWKWLRVSESLCMRESQHTQLATS